MRNLRMPMLAAAVVAAGFSVAATATAEQGGSREYVVVYKQGASAQDARQRSRRRRSDRRQNAEIGVATVKSDDAGFQDKAAQQAALDGAAANQPIGYAPPTTSAKQARRHRAPRPAARRATAKAARAARPRQAARPSRSRACSGT